MVTRGKPASRAVVLSDAHPITNHAIAITKGAIIPAFIAIS
jgi:hypothetical protein